MAVAKGQRRLRLNVPVVLVKVHLILLLNFICQYSFTQGDSFSYLTTEHGLRSNGILSIKQDKKGIIWLGTRSGISSFNGLSIKNYKEAYIISGKVKPPNVVQLHVDSDNNVWGVCFGFTLLLNRETDEFEPIRLYERDNAIRSMCTTTSDTIWMGGKRILGFYLIKNKEFQLINKPFQHSVLSLFKSSKNKIWVGTDKKGVYCYDPVKQDFIPIPDLNNYSLNQKITQIQEDDKGQIWIGTEERLIIYNVEKSRTENIDEYNSEFKDEWISTIEKGANGAMLVGIRGKGIVRFNSAMEIIDKQTADIDRPGTLSSNSVRSIFVDKDERLWIGTYSGGLNIYDPHKIKFLHLRHQLRNDNSLLHNVARSVTESQNGELWFGTENGISIYSRDKNKWRFHLNNYDDNINVTELFPDGDKIWAGTFGAGVYLINPVSLETVNFKKNDSDTNSLGSNHILIIFKDSEGNMWFGGLKGMLSVYNTRTKNFKRYSKISVLDIKEYDSLIYFSNYRRFVSLNPETGEITDVIPDFGIFKVSSIVFEPDKKIWLATERGVCNYNPVNDSLKQYTVSDGLASNIINAMVMGTDGKIWFGSNKGISVLNPENGEVINYDKTDGLPFQEINPRTMTTTSQGEIICGGNNGFIIFKPEEFKKHEFPVNIVFKEFYLFNKTVAIGVEGSPLRKCIEHTDHIELSYNQNFFSFEFEAVEFTNPNKIYYTWILEGMDKEWVPLDKHNIASYTNVRPGKYNLRVRATTGREGKYVNERNILITVTPPFWGTLLFRIFAVTTFIILVYLFLTSRLRRLRRQKKLLEQKVEERTVLIKEKNEILMEQAESLAITNTSLEESKQHIEEQAEELKAHTHNLRKANVKLEEQSEDLKFKSEMLKRQANDLASMNKKLEELNSSKDKLFSIIAHDLKNPFSIILGYSDILLSKYKKFTEERRFNYISRIHNSTRIVYNLLNNLLQWSRSQIDLVDPDRVVVDLNDVKRNSLELLKQNITNKDIKIEVGQFDSIKVYADLNMTNTIFQNLLSNAVKFTPINGAISISCKLDGDKATVSIKDYGIGMDKSLMESLFDIGKSSSRAGTEGERGTGLGLILCKEFVTKNGGEIWAESEPGKGSTFYFTLPVARE